MRIIFGSRNRVDGSKTILKSIGNLFSIDSTSNFRFWNVFYQGPQFKYLATPIYAVGTSSRSSVYQPDLTGISTDYSFMQFLNNVSDSEKLTPKDSIMVQFRNKLSRQGLELMVQPDWDRNILDGSRFSAKEAVVIF